MLPSSLLPTILLLPNNNMEVDEGDIEEVENVEDYVNEDDLLELVEDEEPKDDSTVTFKEHSDAVLCCSLDQNATYAVSGGQDDKAFVWSVATGDIKFECSGHKDSVIAVEFNFDSTLVVTAGMDGLVQAFDVQSGFKVWDYEVSEITWLHWHPKCNVLFAGTVDGNCWKWSVPESDISSVFPTQGSGTFCGLLVSDGSKMAVGYQDGSVKLWNTEDQSVCSTLLRSEAHSDNVTSLTCSEDGNLVISGSEDSKAKLIRTSNCKVLETWNLSSSGSEETESVESVCFLKSHPFVAMGTNYGKLKVFETSTHNLRFETIVDDVIVKIVPSKMSPHLYIATSLDVYLYDGRTDERLGQWSGHAQQIQDLALSKDEKTIVTASDDKTCKVFKL